MSRTIRVDNDVLLYLQRKAVYGDSINAVIRRELKLPKESTKHDIHLHPTRTGRGNDVVLCHKVVKPL